MSPADWNKHVDFYMREDRMHNSIVNTGNRSKQNYPSTHGTKALVEYRYDRHLADPNKNYPSLVEGFGIHHKKKGKYVNRAAEKDHDLMLDLERAQVGKANPLTDTEILEQVLGSRRGHKLGRGRTLPDSISYDLLPTQSQPLRTLVYTQSDVDAIVNVQQMQIKSIQSQQEAMLQALQSQGISVSFPSIQQPQIPSSSGSGMLADEDDGEEEDDGSEEDEEDEEQDEDDRNSDAEE